MRGSTLESDLYRRQILTSKVSFRAKRVNTLFLTIYVLLMYVNKQQGPIFMICHYSILEIPDWSNLQR